MKKIIVLALVALLSLTMSACSKDDGSIELTVDNYDTYLIVVPNGAGIIWEIDEENAENSGNKTLRTVVDISTAGLNYEFQNVVVTVIVRGSYTEYGNGSVVISDRHTVILDYVGGGSSIIDNEVEENGAISEVVVTYTVADITGTITPIDDDSKS